MEDNHAMFIMIVFFTQIMVQGLNLKGKLPYNVTHLKFEDQQFTGQLPPFNGFDKLQRASFGDSSYLKSLNLSGHHISGDIQASLNGTGMQISRFNLTGTLNSSVVKLDPLPDIRLSGINLSCRVPKNMSSLKAVRLLNLSDNISPPFPNFSMTVQLVLDENMILSVYSGDRDILFAAAIALLVFAVLAIYLLCMCRKIKGPNAVHPSPPRENRELALGNLDIEQGNQDREQENLEIEQGNQDIEQENLEIEQGNQDIEQGNQDIEQENREIEQGNQNIEQGNQEIELENVEIEL